MLDHASPSSGARSRRERGKAERVSLTAHRHLHGLIPRWWWTTIALLLGVSAQSAFAAETDGRLGADNANGWGFFPAKDRDPNLPNVLLIGDSILGGYRGTVVERLRGLANVDVFLNPFHQASSELYPQLRAALARGENYRVIHFNMGLHGWQKGRIPEGQFVPLTQKLVDFLRASAPSAQLIWASSTPVRAKDKPAVLDDEINSAVILQNQLAAQIMKEKAVPVDDLYGLMLERLSLARAGDQFHWSPAGSTLQGTTVASQILAMLPRGSAERDDRR